jgi:hypothetical protein
LTQTDGEEWIIKFHILLRLTQELTYDLTYSSSIGGEHATCVNGNGWNPGIEVSRFLPYNINNKSLYGLKIIVKQRGRMAMNIKLDRY